MSALINEREVFFEVRLGGYTQKQIASNNAVIVSIKARKKAEKDGAGEKLVEGVSGAVAEKVGKEEYYTKLEFQRFFVQILLRI